MMNSYQLLLSTIAASVILSIAVGALLLICLVPCKYFKRWRTRSTVTDAAAIKIFARNPSNPLNPTEDIYDETATFSSMSSLDRIFDKKEAECVELQKSTKSTGSKRQERHQQYARINIDSFGVVPIREVKKTPPCRRREWVCPPIPYLINNEEYWIIVPRATCRRSVVLFDLRTYRYYKVAKYPDGYKPDNKDMAFITDGHLLHLFCRGHTECAVLDLESAEWHFEPVRKVPNLNSAKRGKHRRSKRKKQRLGGEVLAVVEQESPVNVPKHAVHYDISGKMTVAVPENSHPQFTPIWVEKLDLLFNYGQSWHPDKGFFHFGITESTMLKAVNPLHTGIFGRTHPKWERISLGPCCLVWGTMLIRLIRTFSYFGIHGVPVSRILFIDLVTKRVLQTKVSAVDFSKISYLIPSDDGVYFVPKCLPCPNRPDVFKMKFSSFVPLEFQKMYRNRHGALTHECCSESMKSIPDEIVRVIAQNRHDALTQGYCRQSVRRIPNDIVRIIAQNAMWCPGSFLLLSV